MITKLIPAGVLALGLAISMASVTPAAAGNLNFTIGIEKNQHKVTVKKHYRGRHLPYWHKKPRHLDICTPGKAVHKAERKGLRRARIEQVGHRFVLVKGRSGGSRVQVAFYRNSAECKIAWVDRSRNYRHGRIQF